MITGHIGPLSWCLHGKGAWVRVSRHVLILKGPRMVPLFGERNGLTPPLLRAFGWRLFFEDDAKLARALYEARSREREVE